MFGGKTRSSDRQVGGVQEQVGDVGRNGTIHPLTDGWLQGVGESGDGGVRELCAQSGIYLSGGRASGSAFEPEADGEEGSQAFSSLFEGGKQGRVKGPLA